MYVPVDSILYCLPSKFTLSKSPSFNEFHVFSFQNADGRKGDMSGRPKNSEQSSVQHVKAHKNPEETRKQRVCI